MFAPFRSYKLWTEQSNRNRHLCKQEWQKKEQKMSFLIVLYHLFLLAFLFSSFPLLSAVVWIILPFLTAMTPEASHFIREVKKAAESAFFTSVCQIQPLEPVLLSGNRRDSGTHHLNMAWNVSKIPAWWKCEADRCTTLKHNRLFKGTDRFHFFKSLFAVRSWLRSTRPPVRAIPQLPWPTPFFSESFVPVPLLQRRLCCHVFDFDSPF